MTIPKVKFRIAKPREILPLINFFLNPNPKGWDWSHYILNNYPELRRSLSKVKDKQKRKKITNVFFEKEQKKRIFSLEKARDSYHKSWDKINDRVMVVLSEVIQNPWPKNCETITARTSLCPINPRYIKSRTFDVFYGTTPHNMKAIAIHEILHFIYFEKWKKVFPDTPEKKFDAPYLIWDLSEIVTSIILSDRRIQKILRHKMQPYKEHMKMKINGKCILNHIDEIYKKRKDFEDFLRRSWAFVKKHNEDIGGKI